MRLALLGLDETTLALARVARGHAQDKLILLCETDPNEQSSIDVLAGIPVQPWETLLTAAAGGPPACDAVLVSRAPHDDETRLEQLRKLVQAAVPMLLSHPVHPSMLAYYELDMIRRESGCIMAPCLPARQHPFAASLKTWIERPDESPLGEVDQVLFVRSLAERSKPTVVAQFARDVDLLRFLGGEVAQLGAMGSPGLTPAGELLAYNNLAVHMAGRHNRALRWSIATSDELAGGRLTVSGSLGQAVLTMPHDQGSDVLGPKKWQLETRAGGEHNVIETADWHGPAAALDELRSALTDRSRPSRWLDAARSVELAETVDRSLAKGRTIDLHEQEYSETATFKGLMTSIGCGLLLIALVALVVGALAANLLRHAGAERAAQVVGVLPYVLLVVFGLFLAVQFLLKLTSGAASTGANGAKERDSGNSNG